MLLVVADVPILINRCIGYRTDEGTFVAALNYKKDPIMPGVADTATRLLARAMDELLPGATPVVLEARTRKTKKFRSCSSTTNADRTLETEVLMYRYMRPSDPRAESA